MLSKLIESWKLIRERSRKTIRRKIRRLVFLCSGFSILILGLVTLYGIFGVRSDAIDTGEKIGEFAIKTSSQSLETARQEYMETLARERAVLIDNELDDMKDNVEVLQRAVTRIVNLPEDFSAYPLRYIAEATPTDGDGENYMAWVFYAPDFISTESVQNEIGRLANLQTMMIGVAEKIGQGKSITPYIASVNGFIFEADNKLPEWAFPDKTAARAQTFNFYDRPWFSNAPAKGKLFFTEPYNGGRDGILAVSCAAPYYQNGEFAGVVGIGATLDRVSALVLDTKISGEGFCFVLDNGGHVILSQLNKGVFSIASETEKIDLRKSSDEDISFMAKEMLRNTSGHCKMTLEDKTYNVAFSQIPTTNWSFAVAIEDTVVNQILDKNRAFIRAETEEQVRGIGERIFQTMLLLITAIFIIIVFVGYWGQRLSGKLTAPIIALADKVRVISAGNLNEKIEIKTGDEIEHLATCFNAMTDELQKQINNLTQITAEKEKIATELNVAQNIQLSMLPHDFSFDGRADFEIFATMNAAKMVGGDFYDFYLLDENHLVITIADVSGKGIPAALFMANSKTILRNFAMTMTSPDDLAAVMTLANNQLCQGNDEMMFVTVFMGMLDLKTGRFIFVNGGHNPPMWYSRTARKFEYLQLEENCVLGMMEDLDFVQQEISLDAGDILYLYTDGVTEAMDEQNNQYGEKRLDDFLNSLDAHSSLEEILNVVRADLALHVGNAEQSDDITMLAVRLK